MEHQGIDKVQEIILHRFEWPGMRKAIERWVMIARERSKENKTPSHIGGKLRNERGRADRPSKDVHDGIWI